MAKNKTSDFQTRIIQQKITQTLKLLPEHERRKVSAEEEKRRKIELREAKIDVWKKWRQEPQEQISEKRKLQKQQQEEWLDNLESTLSRLKQEEMKRIQLREIYNARREQLLKDKKNKQEEMLRKEQKKKERKFRKRMLEERWQVARRTTDYIDDNLERY